MFYLSFHSKLLWIPISPLSDFLVRILFVPYILVFQMNTLFYAVFRSFSNGFIYTDTISSPLCKTACSFILWELCNMFFCYVPHGAMFMAEHMVCVQ